MYAIISYYLAVLGLGTVAQKALRKLTSERMKLLAQACVGIVAAIILFWPNIALGDTTVETPFGCVKYRIQIVYHDNLPDETFYSGAEEDFVAKAAEITGDARVFNIPKDGSLFAYASSGMNTILRYDLALFSSDASMRIVQRSLDDYATDKSVQNAVDDLGFEYVLILDKGHEPGLAAWYGLSYDYWKGPTSLDESTPGFELVLKEGDMELYRVLPEEELAQQANQEQAAS